MPANAQRFFTKFLEGRNDKEVRVSEWRQHPVVGRLREVSFVSAVKRTMGISPPFAHCHQTQRYRRALHSPHSCTPDDTQHAMPVPLLLWAFKKVPRQVHVLPAFLLGEAHHDQGCSVEEISFVKVVAAVLHKSLHPQTCHGVLGFPPWVTCHVGVESCTCDLCRVFEGGQHVVFESSQTMNDIPFGDHFTVESRWDFSARAPRADGAAQTQAGLSADP